MSILKLLFSKLGGYLAAASAFFIAIFMYKNEKKKRKAADLRADIAEDNVNLLIKEKDIVTDLDILREKDNKKSAKMLKTQKIQLEKLNNESSDDDVVDTIMRMYDKKTDRD